MPDDLEKGSCRRNVAHLHSVLVGKAYKLCLVKFKSITHKASAVKAPVTVYIIGVRILLKKTLATIGEMGQNEQGSVKNLGDAHQPS